MAFSYTRNMDATGKGESYGTFNAASVTGGDIDTGFPRCSCFILQTKGATADKAAVVNETISGGTITGIATIVCTASDTGFWFAKGI